MSPIQACEVLIWPGLEVLAQAGKSKGSFYSPAFKRMKNWLLMMCFRNRTRGKVSLALVSPTPPLLPSRWSPRQPWNTGNPGLLQCSIQRGGGGRHPEWKGLCTHN